MTHTQGNTLRPTPWGRLDCRAVRPLGSAGRRCLRGAAGAALLALTTSACGASLMADGLGGSAQNAGARGANGSGANGGSAGAAPWGSPRIDWEHPSPPVANALGASDRALTSAGFALVPALRAGFLLAEGASTTYALRVEPGRCYAVIAVGEQSVRDVDLYLLDGRGTPVVMDREADPHPSVLLCPAYPGELGVRVHMYSGQGPVHLRAYATAGAPTGQVPLSALVREAYAGAGANGAATAPGSVAGGSVVGSATGGETDGAGLDPATRARLDVMRARLQGTGYSDVSAPVAFSLEPGRSREAPMRLDAGTCYAFATLGSPGVRDSDVFVLDAGNRELVSDTRTDPDALVTDVCPPATVNGAVRVRLYAGTGTVWLATFARRSGGAGANAGAPLAGPRVAATGATQLPPVPVAPVGGPAVPGYPPTGAVGGVAAGPQTGAPAGDSIERSWSVLAHTMNALGLRPLGSPLTNQLSAGQSTANPVRLAAGRCYAFAASSDEGTQGVSLALFDAQGTSLGEAPGQSGTAVLRACPRREGLHSLRVRMGDGGGRYRLGLYEQPR